jgi:hypothetical protein
MFTLKPFQLLQINHKARMKNKCNISDIAQDLEKIQRPVASAATIVKKRTPR